MKKLLIINAGPFGSAFTAIPPAVSHGRLHGLLCRFNSPTGLGQFGLYGRKRSGPGWNTTYQTAAIQMTTATAMTTQTKMRSRVLTWCALGAGIDQGTERNRNGGNDYCYRDNEKSHWLTCFHTITTNMAIRRHMCLPHELTRDGPRWK